MEIANRVSGGRARPLPRVGTTLKAFHRGRSRSAVIVETAEFTSGRAVLTGGRAYLSRAPQERPTEVSARLIQFLKGL
jgi:hypothetical protein